MTRCPFLPVFFEHHQCVKYGRPLPAFADYEQIENVWLGFYGLGKLEAYRFMYAECSSIADLRAWMQELKGAATVQQAAADFAQWMQQRGVMAMASSPQNNVLTAAQWQHWQQHGYLRIPALVPATHCEAVVQLICGQLGADLHDPGSWYNDHPDWHGLMLQVYQQESIAAIRALPAIRRVFAALYGSDQLVANTEKVSFNPPETAHWKFRHAQLHWDIDFARPDLHYIQGLVYLNDVPAHRGPLTLVPGFHHQFAAFMQQYPEPDKAHQQVRQAFTGQPVPGRQGDVVLWLQTLPHAASANHDTLPRFVQYISFQKL